MWPKKYAFEEIRLKKYLPNNKDRFDPHVDSINIESAKRFLVFFIYLDNNDRGETNFPQLGLASPCKKGSLLMFRSEEHTSELQSRSDLVCRLLLEKE